MHPKPLIRYLALFVALGIFGSPLRADNSGSNCPPPFQVFDITAFTEAEAIALWPTGFDAYATEEEAAIDFPDRSFEAFVWSNIFQKVGFQTLLELLDRDGDGFLCVKYKLQEHGSAQRANPDFDPNYVFLLLDQGAP